MKTPKTTIAGERTQRLEYLRGELRAERISYGELAELQSLAAHIKPDDVELLEAAGVPEQPQAQPPDWQNEAMNVATDHAMNENRTSLKAASHSPFVSYEALKMQRDELHRLWDASAAEARRNKARAERLADALRDLRHDIDCYDGMIAEKWASFKKATAALAAYEKEQS